MKKILKSTLSVLIAIILFYLAYTFLLDVDFKKTLFEISFINFLKSAFFLFVSFIISGIELKYIYKKKGIFLSNYDTFTIPYVINIWGVIIPLQGSFLYLITYLKTKYKAKVKDSFYLYAFIFLVSLSFFGIVGLVVFPFMDLFSIEILMILCFIAFSPLLLILSLKIIKLIHFKHKLLISLITSLQYILNNVSELIKNFKTLSVIIFFNILTTLVNTFWAYWISSLYNLEISFGILLLVSIIMKLSMLFKITPGNLGVTQLANGGVFILFGHDASVGVFISIFQFLTLFLFSYPFGLLFTLINLKFFTFSDLKELFSYKSVD